MHNNNIVLHHMYQICTSCFVHIMTCSCQEDIMSRINIWYIMSFTLTVILRQNQTNIPSLHYNLLTPTCTSCGSSHGDGTESLDALYSAALCMTYVPRGVSVACRARTAEPSVKWFEACDRGVREGERCANLLRSFSII